MWKDDKTSFFPRSGEKIVGASVPTSPRSPSRKAKAADRVVERSPVRGKSLLNTEYQKQKLITGFVAGQNRSRLTWRAASKGETSKKPKKVSSASMQEPMIKQPPLVQNPWDESRPNFDLKSDGKPTIWNETPREVEAKYGQSRAETKYGSAIQPKAGLDKVRSSAINPYSDDLQKGIVVKLERFLTRGTTPPFERPCTSSKSKKIRSESICSQRDEKEWPSGGRKRSPTIEKGKRVSENIEPVLADKKSRNTASSRRYSKAEDPPDVKPQTAESAGKSGQDFQSPSESRVFTNSSTPRARAPETGTSNASTPPKFSRSGGDAWSPSVAEALKGVKERQQYYFASQLGSTAQFGNLQAEGASASGATSRDIPISQKGVASPSKSSGTRDEGTFLGAVLRENERRQLEVYQSYERDWANFIEQLESSEKSAETDMSEATQLPVPPGSGDDKFSNMLELCKMGFVNGDPGWDKKRSFRWLQRRYHPDKFVARYGTALEKLGGADYKNRITRRILQIASNLNKEWAKV